jgi:hypothetical protein
VSWGLNYKLFKLEIGSFFTKVNIAAKLPVTAAVLILAFDTLGDVTNNKVVNVCCHITQ